MTKPRHDVSDESTRDTRTRHTATPFDGGFWSRAGQWFRRIIPADLGPDAAAEVQAPVKVHEFVTLPGAVEDVTDIVLNIKSLVIKNHCQQFRPQDASIAFRIWGLNSESVFMKVKLEAFKIFGPGVVVVDHGRSSAGVASAAFVGAERYVFTLFQIPGPSSCLVLSAQIGLRPQSFPHLEDVDGEALPRLILGPLRGSIKHGK